MFRMICVVMSVLAVAAESAFGQSDGNRQVRLPQCTPNNQGGYDCEVEVPSGTTVELEFEAGVPEALRLLRLGARLMPLGYLSLPGHDGFGEDSIGGYSASGEFWLQTPRIGGADWFGAEMTLGVGALVFGLGESEKKNALASGVFSLGPVFRPLDWLELVVAYQWTVAGTIDRTLAHLHEGVLRLGFWVGENWRLDVEGLAGWAMVVRDVQDFPTNDVGRDHITGATIEVRAGLTYSIW